MSQTASILFMLAVPASVVTGFGIGFYRLSRQASEEQLVEDDEVDSQPPQA